MQGKIVKGIAGFYYVHVVESGVYECKAKGIFRKDKKKPLVGDDVEIEVLSEVEKTGSIINIFERKNELIRPAVANIDQALLLFAIKDPAAKEEKNMETLRRMLEGKTTAIAGPSGVGKSSIINFLNPKANMETGSISRKIERGKHTTRHSELFMIGEDSYIMDTPGFSSLYVNDFEKEELKYYFPEFEPYEGQCRFNGCDHIHEPGCAVKEAVEKGKIHAVRYEDYKELYEELKNKRRY